MVTERRLVSLFGLDQCGSIFDKKISCALKIMKAPFRLS